MKEKGAILLEVLLTVGVIVVLVQGLGLPGEKRWGMRELVREWRKRLESLQETRVPYPEGRSVTAAAPS